MSGLIRGWAYYKPKSLSSLEMNDWRLPSHFDHFFILPGKFGFRYLRTYLPQSSGILPITCVSCTNCYTKRLNDQKTGYRSTQRTTWTLPHASIVLLNTQNPQNCIHKKVQSDVHFSTMFAQIRKSYMDQRGKDWEERERDERIKFHLKATVCNMAPKHCTMLVVIKTSTCSSRWRFGSWKRRKFDNLFFISSTRTKCNYIIHALEYEKHKCTL